jgi:hypothetical protein
MTVFINAFFSLLDLDSRVLINKFYSESLVIWSGPGWVSHVHTGRIAIYLSNPSWTEVYFCHQNKKAKNTGNFTTLLKPRTLVLI